MFTLQAKIEELTRERENLTKENDVVRNEVHSHVHLELLVSA